MCGFSVVSIIIAVVYKVVFCFVDWAALDFYGALRSRTYDRSISKVCDILLCIVKILKKHCTFFAVLLHKHCKILKRFHLPNPIETL